LVHETSPTAVSSENPGLRSINSHRPRTFRRNSRFAWLDGVIAVCAAGGLTASALYNVQIATSTFAASDFKTLYASVWCFVHRMDAYSIPNLQQVFVSNGVIQPERWYGHAPVYPPTTLALLSPMATLGMVHAAYALTILSGVLLAVAIAALMRYAANNFDLGPAWRIVIAGLCACGPLLTFGMAMGNVSLAVSALCFLAFVWRKQSPFGMFRSSPWLPAIALAVAFILKPHLGLWAGIAMLLLPERAARAVALRAVGLVAGFAVLSLAVMAAMGTLALETHSCLAMLSAETSAGASMNVSSREPLPVVAQITSLGSIVGFWVTNPVIRVTLTGIILLALGFLAVRQTRRVNTGRGALLAVGMWCTLGMLATYHRAHDAVLLIAVVPWVVDRVRRAPLAWHAWAVAVLYCAMSVSADFPVVARWVSQSSSYSLEAFVLLRQVGLADLMLLLVLLLAMAHERTRQLATLTLSAESDQMPIAA
jgi:hypothetical protein